MGVAAFFTEISCRVGMLVVMAMCCAVHMVMIRMCRVSVAMGVPVIMSVIVPTIAIMPKVVRVVVIMAFFLSAPLSIFMAVNMIMVRMWGVIVVMMIMRMAVAFEERPDLAVEQP